MSLHVCKCSSLLNQNIDNDKTSKAIKHLLKYACAICTGKNSDIEASFRGENDLQFWFGLVDEDDNTLLHLSVGVYSCLEITKILLKLGADTSKVNCFGSTPLHLAVTRKRNIEIVKELLRYGACINVRNGEGHTPLQLAVEFNRDPEVVRELLKQGADVSKADNLGTTPLHEAVTRRKCFEIMKILLQHGADPGKPNKFGITALHKAVMEEKDPETIKELAEHGNCINVSDNKGNTPLHFAIIYRRAPEIFRVLLECGADVIKINPIGETVLRKGVTNTCEFLKFRKLVQYLGQDEAFDIINSTLNPDNVIMSLKLLMKYALIQGFEGNYCKIFNSEEYEEMEDIRIFFQEYALDRFFEKCAFEVAQMKLTMINAYVSLYTFLTRKTNGALYPNGETIGNITPEALISNYPLYYDIISPKVKYALERATLLSKYIWMHVSILNRVLEKRNVLMNYDCVSLIAKYLSNEDMSNFIMTYQDYIQDIERFLASSNYPATALKRFCL